MTKDMIKCKFGCHQYEVYKEEDYIHPLGVIIGKVIINRCKHCGKIKAIHIKTRTYE